MNTQLAFKDKKLYVLEVNPRASRTGPFVAKATGVPIAKIASKVMIGDKLKDLLPDNFSLTDLALKWILMHKEVTVVIPGAKNKSQVNMNVKASELEDIYDILENINSIINTIYI